LNPSSSLFSNPLHYITFIIFSLWTQLLIVTRRRCLGKKRQHLGRGTIRAGKILIVDSFRLISPSSEELSSVHFAQIIKLIIIDRNIKKTHTIHKIYHKNSIIKSIINQLVFPQFLVPFSGTLVCKFPHPLRNLSTL